MEKINTNDDQQAIQALYDHVLSLLVTLNMKPWEAKKRLESEGVSPEAAEKLVDEAMKVYNTQVVRSSNKNMVIGGLWCVGGTVVTIISSGAFLAWGAIIYGGIQFFNGYNIRGKRLY